MVKQDLEKNLKQDAVEFLSAIKGLWFYSPQDRFTASIPDLIFCYKGKFGSIELKKSDGRVRKSQQITMRKIRECGGISFVAYNMEHVRSGFAYWFEDKHP